MMIFNTFYKNILSTYNDKIEIHIKIDISSNNTLIYIYNDI